MDPSTGGADAQSRANAAETPERNREILASTREEMREMRAAVAGNDQDPRGLAADTRGLRSQVEQARDAVRDTPTPDVGDSDDGADR